MGTNKYLLIFGRKFKVQEVFGLKEKENLWGDVCFETDVIRVDAGASEYNLKQTVLHEMFHGVWERCGINCADIPSGIQDIINDSHATAVVDNFAIEFKYVE